jgi:alanyl-tRNA synthetase
VRSCWPRCSGPALQISGEQAFELYDTYGFPLELTEEIAEEHGLAVDLAGFEAAMEEQRQRAKARLGAAWISPCRGRSRPWPSAAGHGVPGYEALEHPSQVMALVVNGEQAQAAVAGDEVQIVLDQTPFYGESGGQVGDRGVLAAPGAGRGRGDRADRRSATSAS